MNSAATAVLEHFSDVVLGYGHSDEYSFVLRRDTKLYERRASKITSLIVSLFTSAFVMNWPSHFPTQPLLQPPCFDARAVLYPSECALRDYVAWRQADCHINNQYNACFWALVHGGASNQEAQARLRGTLTKDKNEILYQALGIAYSALPEMHRRGSAVFRAEAAPVSVKVRPLRAGSPGITPKCSFYEHPWFP